MEGVPAEPPLHFGDYPNGAYWSADRADSANTPGDDYSVDGNVLRFMWDYGVVVPLWDAAGLLPEEPEWLRGALSLSDQLVEALTEWGRAMNRADATPWGRTSRAEREAAYRDLDVRARGLVERLRHELAPRWEVTYRPWGGDART